jgi:hypothetical protein
MEIYVWLGSKADVLAPLGDASFASYKQTSLDTMGNRRARRRDA